jgi:hypothetical protein
MGAILGKQEFVPIGVLVLIEKNVDIAFLDT